MKGILILFRWIFELIAKWKGFIPPGIASIFVLTNFFINIITKGTGPAFKELAINLFAAEQTIHSNVVLAINNNPAYGLDNFFAIIGSVFIIWYFIKWTTKLLVKISGSQAEWGAGMIAIVVLCIVEMSVDFAVNGTITFIPIWDGIIFLIINIWVVFSNIHIFGYNISGNNITNNLVDKTGLFNQTLNVSNTSVSIENLTKEII